MFINKLLSFITHIPIGVNIKNSHCKSHQETSAIRARYTVVHGLCSYVCMHVLGVKQYGSSPYCILPSSILQYIAILQYMTKNHFMGMSCTQLVTHVLCS